MSAGLALMLVPLNGFAGTVQDGHGAGQTQRIMSIGTGMLYAVAPAPTPPSQVLGGLVVTGQSQLPPPPDDPCDVCGCELPGGLDLRSTNPAGGTWVTCGHCLATAVVTESG